MKTSPSLKELILSIGYNNDRDHNDQLLRIFIRYLRYLLRLRTLRLELLGWCSPLILEILFEGISKMKALSLLELIMDHISKPQAKLLLQQSLPKLRNLSRVITEWNRALVYGSTSDRCIPSVT